MDWLGRTLAIVTCIVTFAPAPVAAHPPSPSSALARGIPEIAASNVTTRGITREGPLSFTPVELSSQVRATIVAPTRWQPIGNHVQRTVAETYRDITTLFGPIPTVNSTIRLMEEETFFLATGAPRWTNALFYRGQVLIPLALEVPPDEENIYRAVRHEFTHALLHSLSDGRAPGWLDEGLAQWAEGDENPALQPALRNWLAAEDPIPLRLLLGGFTRLEERMVAAAYAQSLFAANTLIQSFGFKRISRYFELLRTKMERSRAFAVAFGLTEETFERELHQGLLRWSTRDKSGESIVAPLPVRDVTTETQLPFQSTRSQLR